MAAVANNPEFAKKAGVPQSVGKEFTMNKYAQGGAMRPKPRPGIMDAPRPKPRPSDMEEPDMMEADRSRGVTNRELLNYNRARSRMGKPGTTMKSGGKVKKMAGGGSCGTKMYAKGGKVRGDGVCSKGHTKGRMV